MSTPRHFDYLILGAGPAGLQLGYHLQSAGHDYLILEQGSSAGEFFKRYPRHGTLISINKVHTGYDDDEINLRWDWNSLLSDDNKLLFREFSESYWPKAEAMVRYLGIYAMVFDLAISYDTTVTRVCREGELFHLEDTAGHLYTCHRLIVATGLSRPFVPDIPGIELAEVYNDMSVDAEEYAGQAVLVLGKANSAFETADHLTETTALIHVASPHPVSLAWKTHFVGNLRAINNNFLDTYQLKSQNAVLDCDVKSLHCRDDGKIVASVAYAHAEGEQEELIYDRVLCCTGFRFDDSIFDDSCKPALAILDKFPAQTSAWESTSVPHLYIAGTLMQMRDYKKATSGFIHGFRYNVRCLARILDHRYHDAPIPHREIPATLDDILEAILGRVNRSSALWQQFGYLSDLLVVNDERARYYEELPMDYVHDSELGRSSDYYLITLEFGKVTGDPFNIARSPMPDKADSSVFLHPVVRHFSSDEQLSELHLLENLYGEWKDVEQHIEPLREFLRGEMQKTQSLLSSRKGSSALQV